MKQYVLLHFQFVDGLASLLSSAIFDTLALNFESDADQFGIQSLQIFVDELKSTNYFLVVVTL